MILNKKKILTFSVASALIITATLCVYSISSKSKAKNTNEPPLTEKEGTTAIITETETEQLTEVVTVEDYLANEETTTAEPVTSEESTTQRIRELQFESNGNGTCTLVGIGNVNDSCIVIPEKSSEGDVVTTIAANAFYSNTKITTVQIPSTVTSIGEKAFGGCTSLVYISVNNMNNSFCDVDGVLYSKSGDTLIHYPAKKGNEAISISKTVVKICDMAFYHCDSLRKISFSGSMSQWSKIIIGEMNYGLYSASVVCADSQGLD